MADLKVITQTKGKSYAGQGQRSVDVVASLEGALSVQEYLYHKAIEGKIFTASAGSGTTTAAFVAAASFNLNLPMLAVDVPAGVTIIPVEIQVYFEATGGTIVECFAHTGTGLVGVGTSTTLTAYSTRRRSAQSSACTARGPYTSAGTSPDTPVEFWRGGNPQDLDAVAVQSFFDYHVGKGVPQIIEGAGCLAVYATAATSSSGFIRVSWIEYATGQL